MREIHKQLVRDSLCFWGERGWALHHDNVAKTYGFKFENPPTRAVRYLNGYCCGGVLDDVRRDEIVHEYLAGAKVKIVHWLGTDVLQFIKGHVAPPPPDAVNLCDSWNLRVELLSKGIDARVVHHTPRNAVPEVLAIPAKRRLAVYMPPLRHDFFRYDLMKQVEAAITPGWEVEWISPTPSELFEQKLDFKAIMSRCSAYLRCPIHDGFSHTSAEFVMAGRTVLTTEERPYQVRVLPDVKDIVSKLNEPPFLLGAPYYRWMTHPDRLFEVLYEIITDRMATS